MEARHRRSWHASLRRPVRPSGRCHCGLHSQSRDAFAGTPRAAHPGTIGWHELYTTDLEGGFDFYNKLFGWTKVSDMDMGPMGTYRIFDEGDHKPMGDGGMMTKPPKVPVSKLELLLSTSIPSMQPSNGSKPAAARSSMVRCRYPAVAGLSRARTLRVRSSLSSVATPKSPQPDCHTDLPSILGR